jgi:hypothetical protein
MSTICLNMIVKNEASVVTRCLDSVLPFIDCWTILDTGSTDGTQEIIRSHLAGLPGDLYERPWTDFGQARTQAIQLAGSRADYLFFMDADDRLVCPPDYAFPPLIADGYALRFQMGDEGTERSFLRTCLVASRLSWRYSGVLHEGLDCPDKRIIHPLVEPFVLAENSVARRDDQERFHRDAQILEAALRDDPGNTRYVFYLAQSYWGEGRLEEALATYQRRVAMGGWEEEVYTSLFQLAVLMEQLGRPEETVVQAYLKAYQARPTRAEPLCALARFCRTRRDFHLALMFAARAAGLPRPADLLVVDESTYRWRSLDEFAVCSFQAGRLQDAREACHRLLSEGFLPAGERARVAANLERVEDCLGPTGILAPPPAPLRKPA